MPLAGEYCALPPHVSGRCRTLAAVTRDRARNVAQRKKTRKERGDKVDAYKLAKGCIDCGYNAHPVALDLDHRDPTLKIADVSSLIGGGAPWDNILAELDKCDVRCACCHRIRTHYRHQERRRAATDAIGEGPCDEI